MRDEIFKSSKIDLPKYKKTNERTFSSSVSLSKPVTKVQPKWKTFWKPGKREKKQQKTTETSFFPQTTVTDDFDVTRHFSMFLINFLLQTFWQEIFFFQNKY